MNSPSVRLQQIYSGVPLPEWSRSGLLCRSRDSSFDCLRVGSKVWDDAAESSCPAIRRCLPYCCKYTDRPENTHTHTLYCGCLSDLRWHRPDTECPVFFISDILRMSSWKHEAKVLTSDACGAFRSWIRSNSFSVTAFWAFSNDFTSITQLFLERRALSLHFLFVHSEELQVSFTFWSIDLSQWKSKHAHHSQHKYLENRILFMLK